MSFLFGGGRPQLSSEQKIANAEIEVEMVNDMLTRYVYHLVSLLAFHHWLRDLLFMSCYILVVEFRY